jgi:hypothetical protein
MPGVGNQKVMPIFMFSASDDLDVAITDAGDPANDKGVFIPISPTGQALGFPANGAYELASTAIIAGNFNPNDPLTSPDSGANAGLLTVGTMHTNMICGIVSRGVVDNGYGIEAVAFWPERVYP